MAVRLDPFQNIVAVGWGPLAAEPPPPPPWVPGILIVRARNISVQPLPLVSAVQGASAKLGFMPGNAPAAGYAFFPITNSVDGFHPGEYSILGKYTQYETWSGGFHQNRAMAARLDGSMLYGVTNFSALKFGLDVDILASFDTELGQSVDDINAQYRIEWEYYTGSTVEWQFLHEDDDLGWVYTGPYENLSNGSQEHNLSFAENAFRQTGPDAKFPDDPDNRYYIANWYVRHVFEVNAITGTVANPVFDGA